MTKKRIALDRKKGLYLKEVSGKGRGVFCTEDVRKGEILEVSPSVILNETATNHIDKTILLNYTFMTGNIPKCLRDRASIKSTGKSSAVIMGIASFCNHDDRPNAEILWEEKDGTLYYTLQATRRIPKHTEICTSYGNGWFDNRD